MCQRFRVGNKTFVSQSSPKHLLFEQFAMVGKAFASSHRLELLDVLIQGERRVETLARSCGLSIGNASQHLQHLRRAGLVTRRKRGKQVIYSLVGIEVADLVRALWRVAERNVAEIERVLQRFYRDRDSMEPVTRDELLTRLHEGSVIVVDVRPAEEYAAGHVPSAMSVPLDELEQRLAELPRGKEIVACCRGPYCVYSYEAIDILRPKGFRVRRLQGGYLEWFMAGLPVENRAHASVAD